MRTWLTFLPQLSQSATWCLSVSSISEHRTGTHNGSDLLHRFSEVFGGGDTVEPFPVCAILRACRHSQVPVETGTADIRPQPAIAWRTSTRVCFVRWLAVLTSPHTERLHIFFVEWAARVKVHDIRNSNSTVLFSISAPVLGQMTRAMLTRQVLQPQRVQNPYGSTQ